MSEAREGAGIPSSQDPGTVEPLQEAEPAKRARRKGPGMPLPVPMSFAAAGWIPLTGVEEFTPLSRPPR